MVLVGGLGKVVGGGGGTPARGGPVSDAGDHPWSKIASSVGLLVPAFFPAPGTTHPVVWDPSEDAPRRAALEAKLKHLKSAVGVQEGGLLAAIEAALKAVKDASTTVEMRRKLEKLDKALHGLNVAYGRADRIWHPSLTTTIDGEYTLHAFPCERVHGLDVSHDGCRSFETRPSAWASAVGRTATVVRISQSRVLTAKHAWEQISGGVLGQEAFVVFDFDAPDPDPRLFGYPRSEPTPYNGWNRAVEKVYKATLASEGDGGGASGDWVVLQIKWLGAKKDEMFEPPFDIAPTDWHAGAIDRESDPLVLIGHPLGCTKTLAANGKVHDHGESLFEHDLEVYSGSSGSPIFQGVRTRAGSAIWLVGISLGGRGLEQVSNGGQAPAKHDDNLALDISAFSVEFSTVESIAVTFEKGALIIKHDDDESPPLTNDELLEFEFDGSGGLAFEFVAPKTNGIDAHTFETEQSSVKAVRKKGRGKTEETHTGKGTEAQPFKLALPWPRPGRKSVHVVTLKLKYEQKEKKEKKEYTAKFKVRLYGDPT